MDEAFEGAAEIASALGIFLAHANDALAALDELGRASAEASERLGQLLTRLADELTS